MKISINLSREEYEAVLSHKNQFAKDIDEDMYFKSILAIGLKYFVEDVIRSHNEKFKNDPEYRQRIESDPSFPKIPNQDEYLPNVATSGN